VRFDDRLLTVLNLPAEDRHDAAVRWRQLVDLVARAGSNGSSPVVTEALEAIRNEAPQVDESLRAAAARSVAALPLPLGLLEYFASDSLTVSAPVLAAATLEMGQWNILHAAADQETRGFIETLHPALKSMPKHEAPPPQVQPNLTPPDSAERFVSPSLHELVERIERRRRLGSAQIESSDSATEQAPPSLFRWECGPGGEIAWVEGAPRGPLIGRSIAKAMESDGDRIDPDVVRSFGRRAPFRDAMLAVAGGGPVSGEWKISGVPAFEPADGRFAGYRGVALRETPAPPASPNASSIPRALSDPDSLRELVHEIKTPLNAIIGFAEIIEGQYLGPADRGYRDRAAEIVRQARTLLTAIDDLDFAAKVHSATGGPGERVDLGAVVERAAEELRTVAQRHTAEIEIGRIRRGVVAATEPELAGRLLIRLFEALTKRAEGGERLQLSVEQGADGARISITRPKALRGLSDIELFESELRGDGLAALFPLRLTRGLARVAGGDVVGSRDTFSLVLPRG
jgi:hypothetical protein